MDDTTCHRKGIYMYIYVYKRKIFSYIFEKECRKTPRFLCKLHFAQALVHKEQNHEDYWQFYYNYNIISHNVITL